MEELVLYTHDLCNSTNEHTSLSKYVSLTFYSWKFCDVWEMSGDRDRLLYWPNFFSWP